MPTRNNNNRSSGTPTITITCSHNNTTYGSSITTNITTCGLKLTGINISCIS
jgi:hypothetical protein